MNKESKTVTQSKFNSYLGDFKMLLDSAPELTHQQMLSIKFEKPVQSEVPFAYKDRKTIRKPFNGINICL